MAAMAAEVDIATLGIKVDATTADDAAHTLDNLTKSGERAESATKGVASGSDAMRAAINAAIAAINANTNAMSGLTDRTNNYRNSATGAASATDDMEARVAKLKATIDPMGTAIDRVNAELAEARLLFEAGAMSAEDYARAQVVLNARSADFSRRQGLMNDAMGVGARSAKLQAHEMLNLSRQFADIGVTAAMGMNPLMNLVQQGPQIADTLATARARGIGTADAFRQVGQTVMPWVTRLGPALGVGAVALAATALAANRLSQGLGDVQSEFGFTAEQMERLKDKGTDLGVTMGDVMTGVGRAVKHGLTEAFGPEIDKVQEWWNDFLDDTAKGAIAAVADIVGSFVGGYYGIKAAWSVLPGAIGDIAISAANVTISAVEDMINGVGSLINGLIDKANAAAEKVGLNGNLSRVGTVSFGRFDNPYAGQANRAIDEISSASREGYNRGSSAVRSAANAVGRFTMEAREERIREDAGDPNKGRKGRDRKARESEEEKDWKKAVEGANEYTKALREQTEEIGKNQFEVKRLHTSREAAELQAAAAALGTAEAMETASRLTAEMTQATEEWIKATNAQKIKEMKQELQDEATALEFEQRTMSMNNEERLKAIKLREISLKILEAERQGYYDVAQALREEAQALVQLAGAAGARQDKVENAQRATEALRDMNDGIREATENFGELFGTAGDGFANLLDVMLDFNERQAEAQERLIEIQSRYAEGQQMSSADAEEYARIQENLAQAQIAHYGNMLSAAKTFFKEGSTGWRVLEAAERVYRLFQFAMAIRAMFMDKTQTASSVANSGARAAADGVAAVAKAIASLPFPLNIAAGAATLAFLVAIGVKMFGGKGGGRGATSAAGGASQMDEYRGPRDEYGAPTSGYSVLRPGYTNVAGTWNQSGGGSPAAMGGITIGDTHLVVQGSLDSATIPQVEEMLAANRTATVQEARRVVHKDMAESSSRQRIGA
jgi:hypothetical protein